ncbi:UDP-glucosyl transferase 80A2, sterol glucosyltransferase [Hibiscus trionum]|uniref:UDP-glucosyl transferase 80A2, sterol glucosyltransferase n=1 Tax=Hibiscus trionum TaxID=183268 RepID=A0A9W7J698_HIBTR|nr:UDP-glucosyl transferase 80A2, sterol glucosyltransferase [Hibiscus trionum]
MDLPVRPDKSLAGQNLHTEASTSAIDSGSNHQSRSLRLNDNVAIYATKFLDDNVPFRKKIKWLSRLANVKHDGTLHCDIPTDMKPHTFDFVFYSEAPEKEDTDTTDIPNIPPLQIVMLIVGTRGDVQPFVAIGKHLQVIFFFTSYQTLYQLFRSIHTVCRFGIFILDCLLEF